MDDKLAKALWKADSPVGWHALADLHREAGQEDLAAEYTAKANLWTLLHALSYHMDDCVLSTQPMLVAGVPLRLYYADVRGSVTRALHLAVGDDRQPFVRLERGRWRRRGQAKSWPRERAKHYYQRFHEWVGMGVSAEPLTLLLRLLGTGPLPTPLLYDRMR